MLRLTRKEKETIIIDGRITITIDKISGNRISIGIEAPQDVQILRGELYAKSNSKQATDTIPTSERRKS